MSHVVPSFEKRRKNKIQLMPLKILEFKKIEGKQPQEVWICCSVKDGTELLETVTH